MSFRSPKYLRFTVLTYREQPENPNSILYIASFLLELKVFFWGWGSTDRGKTSHAFPLFRRHSKNSSHRDHAKNLKEISLYLETNLQKTEEKGMIDIGWPTEKLQIIKASNSWTKTNIIFNLKNNIHLWILQYNFLLCFKNYIIQMISLYCYALIKQFH